MLPETQMKSHKQEPGLFKEDLTCTKMLFFCIEMLRCFHVTSTKSKIYSKVSKRALQKCGYRFLGRNDCGFDENVIIKSTNGASRTNSYGVVTFEQINKRLCNFHPLKLWREMELGTKISNCECFLCSIYFCLCLFVFMLSFHLIQDFSTNFSDSIQ